MNVNEIVLLIGTLFNCALAVVIGISVVKKNPNLKLNKFFAGFFIFTSLGFLGYFLYHIPFKNLNIIWLFYYFTQVMINFGMSSLLMTVFIFKHSEKMAKKYLPRVILLLMFSLIGYLFWKPSLDMNMYANDIISTDIFIGWNFTVNLFRIFILAYAIFVFTLDLQNSTGFIRKKLKFFSIGLIFGIIGIVFAMLNSLDPNIEFLFKIIGVISFSTSSLLLYKGLTLKKEQNKINPKLGDDE